MGEEKEKEMIKFSDNFFLKSINVDLKTMNEMVRCLFENKHGTCDIDLMSNLVDFSVNDHVEIHLCDEYNSDSFENKIYVMSQGKVYYFKEKLDSVEMCISFNGFLLKLIYDKELFNKKFYTLKPDKVSFYLIITRALIFR